MFNMILPPAEGADFNLTILSDPVVTFSPSDVIQDFAFVIRQDGLYEATEVVSLRLRPVAGETAVTLGGDTGRVSILDSDGE